MKDVQAYLISRVVKDTLGSIHSCKLAVHVVAQKLSDAPADAQTVKRVQQIAYRESFRLPQVIQQRCSGASRARAPDAANSVAS